MEKLAQPEFAEAGASEDGTSFGKRVAGQPGIYVLLTKTDATVARFGKKEGCVGARIRHHAKPTNGKNGNIQNISGDLMPYSPKMAWRLPNWPAHRVAMGELAMLGAVRAQGCRAFFSQSRQAVDKSNFVLPHGFDWAAFRARVDNELTLIASLGD